MTYTRSMHSEQKNENNKYCSQH